MNDENQEKIQCENCEQMQKENQEAKAGWIRAVADYQNLQKEVSLQRSEWAVMSERQILEEFIPVYDNFKKAFAHEFKDTNDTNENLLKKFDGWKKGIEYIMKQFGEILRAHQVEEIQTVGTLFDPNVHEIVGEEESETASEHEILREVDGGYRLGTKVIKVAKVVVAKSLN